MELTTGKQFAEAFGSEVDVKMIFRNPKIGEKIIFLDVWHRIGHSVGIGSSGQRSSQSSSAFSAHWIVSLLDSIPTAVRSYTIVRRRRPESADLRAEWILEERVSEERISECKILSKSLSSSSSERSTDGSLCYRCVQ